MGFAHQAAWLVKVKIRLTQKESYALQNQKTVTALNLSHSDTERRIILSVIKSFKGTMCSIFGGIGGILYITMNFCSKFNYTVSVGFHLFVHDQGSIFFVYAPHRANLSIQETHFRIFHFSWN